MTLSTKTDDGRICGSSKIRGKKLERIRGKIRGCGISKPVSVSEIEGVTLSPAATMDCKMAKSLRTWLRKSVKPTLKRSGGGVSSLRVVDHYNCRSRNNVKGAKLSAHSKGRAIDIASFRLEDGTRISVLKDWNHRRDGKKLRAMLARACRYFSTVLGPNHNRLHRDHFHLDRDRPRNGDFCR